MNEESRQPASSSQEPDWDAISRVVAGESDPAEELAVSNWLAAHPADAGLVGFVKTHAERAESAARVSVDVEAALTKVRARMAPPAARSGNETGAPVLQVVRGGIRARSASGPHTAAPVGNAPWWSGRAGRVGLAAAAVAVLAVSIRGWQLMSGPQSASRIVATVVGQRDSLMLTDGTKVVLAPGSRLTVAAGFDEGSRVVELEGAAFFDVHHDETRPFTVRAAGAIIRDVGTAFTVKTDGTGGVSIAVTHGTVAVGSVAADNASPASVELRAGDRGVVSEGNVAVTRGIVSPDDAAWTRGQLSYRDTPLSEVQADLKRWYGITLRVNDSSLTRLTVTMPEQPDSGSLVRTLAALLGASAEQRGDTVVLRTAAPGVTP